MTELPTSEDAKQYDTLEEYIAYTSRDTDNETRKTVLLTDWQEAQMKLIKNSIGCTTVDVCNRAYKMGLRTLRERLGDEIGSLTDLELEFLSLISNMERADDRVQDTQRRVLNIEVGPIDEYGELQDRRTFKIENSILAEVEDTFIENAFFGSWIHRVLIGLGFSESENITTQVEDNTTRIISQLDDEFGRSRQTLEQEINDFVGHNYGFWTREGIRNQVHTKLMEISQNMTTVNGENVQAMMQAPSIEVIPEE